jgi:hypothetical protein
MKRWQLKKNRLSVTKTEGIISNRIHIALGSPAHCKMSTSLSHVFLLAVLAGAASAFVLPTSSGSFGVTSANGKHHGDQQTFTKTVRLVLALFWCGGVLLFCCYCALLFFHLTIPGSLSN